LNIPNFLTILRVIIAPMVYFAFQYQTPWPLIGLVLFIIGSFTDWLDGLLARKYSEVSGFGQFADPVADKLLSGFGMITIAIMGYSYILPIIGIIIRDIFITSFRFWALYKGKKILPSKLAKAKTGIELLGIVGILGYIVLGGQAEGFWIGSTVFIIVFILAWVTGIDYFWKNRSILSG